MRVKDEQAWWEQLTELDGDDASRRFRDFLLAWVDRADVALAGGSGASPREALVAAFAETEEELGFLSVEWLSQMFLVIVQHWFSGAELWESMSPWERRMVEQATAVKLAEMQAAAAMDSTEIDA